MAAAPLPLPLRPPLLPSVGCGSSEGSGSDGGLQQLPRGLGAAVREASEKRGGGVPPFRSSTFSSASPVVEPADRGSPRYTTETMFNLKEDLDSCLLSCLISQWEVHRNFWVGRACPDMGCGSQIVLHKQETAVDLLCLEKKMRVKVILGAWMMLLNRVMLSRFQSNAED